MQRPSSYLWKWNNLATPCHFGLFILPIMGHTLVEATFRSRAAAHKNPNAKRDCHFSACSNRKNSSCMNTSLLLTQRRYFCGTRIRFQPPVRNETEKKKKLSCDPTEGRDEKIAPQEPSIKESNNSSPNLRTSSDDSQGKYVKTDMNKSTSSSPDTKTADETIKEATSAQKYSLTSIDASSIPIRRVVTLVVSHLWPKGETRMKVLVSTSVLCVLMAKVMKVIVPFWFKSVVDTLSPCTTGAAVMAVGPVGVGVFGMVAAYGICRITTSITEELKTALFAPVGGHAATALATKMFSKLHHLDLDFHLNRHTGSLTKDLERGSRAFWSLAYALLFMIIPTAFEMFLVCFALNLQAGPQFIFIALTAIFSYVGWTYTVTNWRSRFRTSFNDAESRVGGLVVDSLLNYETVKYFNREKHEILRISSETSRMNDDLVRLDQTMSLLNFGQQAIFVIAAVSSLYLSTCGVLAGTMTVGDLVLVDALLMQLYMPLSFLGMIYREVLTSTQNMQAMIALLDEKANVIDDANAKPFVYKNGTIELRNVTFEYKKSEGRRVLDNLSLTIPGGKTVAFVGPSGSGKSTIFRLLYRFFDPTSGSITVDGQPLKHTQIQSLRNAIGVIPQDTILFNESVMYNIRYGRVDATDEEVLEASKKACLHDTVVKMVNGYNAAVGERGLKLSGGEKQRVAIARALLEDAPILLADEATSALDSSTEVNVMNVLRNAHRHSSSPRTIILIAHRLSTIREADIIFVLDGKGNLAEQGAHKELLEKDGLYSKLWYQQLREQRMTSVSTKTVS